MKVILHAGSPKTGTTSLQVFMDRNREALLDRGVLYPRTGIAPPPVPKHQWMISTLMNGDARGFTDLFEQAAAEARPDTHTMMLSSEGLFHRWWDFQESGLEALQHCCASFETSIWLFLREPVSFSRSFYIQTLKNPQGAGPCYGEDMPLAQMLRHPRFAIHLDYIGYIRSVEKVMGAASVRPFQYRSNTIADVLQALDITGLEPVSTGENRAVGAFGADLLRQINRRTLTWDQKSKAVRLIEELDALASQNREPLSLDAEEVEMIHALSRDSLQELQSSYGLSFDDKKSC